MGFSGSGMRRQIFGPAFLRVASPSILFRYVKQPQQRCPRRMVAAASRGPADPPPSYARIDANPFNMLFTRVFLSKLENELGRPARRAGYDAVVEIVKALAVRYPNSSELQLASERVLLSLFPAWLPPAFAALFSKPMPAFAAWINAVVTVGVTQWLMGPSHLDDDGVTVNIERCRYLEATGCVGICLNSCKCATESFFHKNMGIDVAIEPNLEDYSCKFSFGKSPTAKKEDPIFKEPCLSVCPMASRSTDTPCSAIE